jgi:hypothetical protein
METVLRGVPYDSCLLYLDDMIVIGRTFQEHLLNLWRVFQRFQEACLKLNPVKFKLAEGSMVPWAYCVTQGDNHQS